MVTFIAGPGSSQDEAPVQLHSGTAINLDSSTTCPTVTKYSALRGASPPPYGGERDSSNHPRRNPILYALQTADDGVGLNAGTTQYRVGLRAGATTMPPMPLLDWSSAGVGSDVATGVKRHW